MGKQIIYLTFLLLSSTFAFAQMAVAPATGTIKGTIKDEATKEAIIGANVVIEGTLQGASTDINGNFVIPKVTPGKVNLVVSFISYRSKKIEGVEVSEGKTTTIHTTVEEDIAQLQDVVIVAAREAQTDIAVIDEIKKSQQIVSGVSAEQISRSQDRDAAQVMMRVPGVTIQDNRFVMIRGVSDRYNQVMINGAIAPSTEIDVRSFAFDLIPSSMIERMMVYKSGSAELPGDFAGGVIKLYTLNAVNENFTNISLGTGIRPGLTFDKFYQSNSSSTDFLGFDNGFRKLPSNFPDRIQGRKEVDLEAVKSLPNNWVPNQITALPDFNFSLGFGRKFSIGTIEASNLTSLSYSNSYNPLQSPSRALYTDINSSSAAQFSYNDNYFEKNNRIGLIHNWRFSLNPNTLIEFRNLYNQIGDHESTVREGQIIPQRGADVEFRNYGFRYQERKIYSGQLQGTHTFNEDRSKLTWLVGSNYLSRNEPDYRRFRTYRTAGANEPYIISNPAGASLGDNSRFYSNLNEYGLSNSVEYEHKIAATEKNPLMYKVGYYTEYKERNYASRYFSYSLRASSTEEQNRLLALTPDQFFAPENLGRNKLFPVEGTLPSDKYNGSNLLAAGYASVSVPFNKFYLSTGLRVEYNQQKVTLDPSLSQYNVNNPVLVPMPFMNLTYDLSNKSMLRLAYSRTVNRPEFRELAKTLYYDFVSEAVVFGNDTLGTAKIHNVDLRYEFYPRPGEAISVAAFYKYFDSPIENYMSGANDGQQQFTYRNAEKASNVGLELEARKSMSDLFAASFLRNLSLVFNSSIIYSEVDMGNSPDLIQERFRPLQGQSPYIVNLGAFYDDRNSGLSINLLYNVFGKRINRVGSTIYSSVYEMPRNVLDLTVTKKVNENFTLKAGVQNILNAPFRYTMDLDRDKKISSVDKNLVSYRRGAYFTLGVTYSF
jgi:outer membrane receptor protein involved in Fe transport